jgi:hypothetical protein
LFLFQNEFWYAAFVDSSSPDANEDVICTVPDLISILGQDGEVIGSQELRYGLRVGVIGMPAYPLWTGAGEELKVGSLEYFYLGMELKSVGKYQAPKSVIRRGIQHGPITGHGGPDPDDILVQPKGT